MLSREFLVGVKYFTIFLKREGHPLVPGNHIESDYRLGIWVANKRAKYKLGKLDINEVEYLNGIGFCWDAYEHRYQMGYDALKKFVMREGHARVPSSWVEDNYPLGVWISSKKKQFKNNKLSNEKILSLKRLGLNFKPRATKR